MTIFQKITNYIKESREELKKVVWPSKKETINLTLLVIFISLGVALFLGIIDWLLTLILGRLIK
ncbi:MAG: preprotein translocase subunit SecE [Patescibacteria group bacterium]